MANPWFRLYSEFATDAKVQSMSEPMQRRLLMLFCLRCSNTLATLQQQELAFALRLSDDELADTKALFMQKKFIDAEWNLLNWNKRQFVSDSSTERSRRHRQKKETPSKRRRNVAATAPDTDTEPDSEERKAKAAAAAEALPEGFAELWAARPQRAGDDPKKKAVSAWRARITEGCTAADMLAGMQRYAAFCIAEGKVGTNYVMHTATFLGPDKRFAGTWKPAKPINGSPLVTGQRNLYDKDYRAGTTNLDDDEPPGGDDPGPGGGGDSRPAGGGTRGAEPHPH